jgi:hypothetical protein
MDANTAATPRSAGTPAWRALLVLGDLLALFLFVLVGQMDHELLPEANPLWYTLTRALPFIAVWLAGGWLVGAFRLPAPGSRPSLLWTLGGRALHGWLLAAPLGLLLRALLLERATIPTLFFAATLGFGALFLLAWRLLFGLLWAGRPSVRRRDAPAPRGHG